MDFSSVNWLAVVACVMVAMLSGAIWYSPRVFFDVWWKGIGKAEDEEPDSSNMGMTWALTVLAAFVQAVGMAFMVPAVAGRMTGGVSAGSGALTGFMLWFGFIAPTYLVNKLFAGHSFKVWGIEVGNHLVNFVIFGAILGAWR
jgi:hypothetical protein